MEGLGVGDRGREAGRPLDIDSAVSFAHQRQAGGGEGGSASPKRRLFTLRKGTSQIKLIKP